MAFLFQLSKRSSEFELGFFNVALDNAGRDYKSESWKFFMEL